MLERLKQGIILNDSGGWEGLSQHHLGPACCPLTIQPEETYNIWQHGHFLALDLLQDSATRYFSEAWFSAHQIKYLHAANVYNNASEAPVH